MGFVLVVMCLVFKCYYNNFLVLEIFVWVRIIVFNWLVKFVCIKVLLGFFKVINKYFKEKVEVWEEIEYEWCNFVFI